MTISKDNTRMLVILPIALKEELKLKADEANRSLNNYIVTVLKDHVDELKT